MSDKITEQSSYKKDKQEEAFLLKEGTCIFITKQNSVNPQRKGRIANKIHTE
jgi:hypothetical protein